jgi:TPR repeat protein
MRFGDSENILRAVEYYKRAADLGYGSAVFKLCHVYFYGDGIPPNNSEGLFIGNAVQHRMTRNGRTYGLFLYHGVNLTKDTKRVSK